MGSLARHPLSDGRSLVYLTVFAGVVALGIVRFGWGLSYNPFLTPFGIMAIGAGLVVIIFDTRIEATFIRVCTGVIILLIATLYIVNLLRVTGPTEGTSQLMGAIAAVLLWAPTGLGFLAGFISTDRSLTSTNKSLGIENPQWVVIALGVLLQAIGLLLAETFVLADPPAFAGIVYAMIALFGLTAWITSYPFYRAGRNSV